MAQQFDDLNALTTPLPPAPADARQAAVANLMTGTQPVISPAPPPSRSLEGTNRTPSVF